jgi:hypothetical protein
VEEEHRSTGTARVKKLHRANLICDKKSRCHNGPP